MSTGKRPAPEEAEAAPAAKKERKPIRIWCDGCYDMMHFGHANSLRQAKLMGDYLIVGVHSDEEIRKNKGPPVMTEQERYEMVRACKWVDEVVENAPYVTMVETLDQYNCDFCVHGDDITTTADGTDCYQIVKDAGRYRECKRTAGVSTTDLVGRMLLLTRRGRDDSEANPIHSVDANGISQLSTGSSKISPYTRVSHFLPTTKKIMQFSDGKEPKPNDKIVYIAGAWDLCHIGHVRALRKAKEFGDFLIVGIHTDSTVEQVLGKEPIMTLHERVLSVLALRYVDEVVIGAPYSLSKDLIDHFKINIVLHGSATRIYPNADGSNPYQAVLDHPTCEFKTFESDSSLLTSDIVGRIITNSLEFQARNDKKNKKELDIIKRSMQALRQNAAGDDS